MVYNRIPQLPDGPNFYLRRALQPTDAKKDTMRARIADKITEAYRSLSEAIQLFDVSSPGFSTLHSRCTLTYFSLARN